MPGHIIHLAAANCVLERMGIQSKTFQNEFLIGSMAPDTMRGNDKKAGHFWSDEMFQRFMRIPDLDYFQKKYHARMKEAYVLGYYGHLYLDALFLNTCWKDRFSFYNRDMQPVDLFDQVYYVKLHSCTEEGVKREQLYLRNLLFSDEYYYGDYDRINPYLFSKYDIAIPTLSTSDSIVGIDELDLYMVWNRLETMNTYVEMNRNIAVGSMVEAMDINRQLKVFRVEDFRQLIIDYTDHMINLI